MKNKNLNIVIAVSILMLATLACNAVIPKIGSNLAPTVVLPTEAQSQGNNSLPVTEAGVPRISPKDAKAAFDSGKAIIVDVRSADAFAAEHIAGAISIPLADIESNIANVKLDNNQWIITYCT